MSSDKINVKFKLIEPGSSKLALVKAIHALRHVTGWGLKESKDFVDSTDPRYNRYSTAVPGILDLNLTKLEVDEFRRSLESCDKIVFELDDASKIRNRKIIELGFYEKDELVRELVEDDLFEILRGKDIEKIRAILTERYSQISENYIKEKLSI